ncbi:aminotransferase-like domain-containing protein [Acinetobacter towneri]|uniref:aminotransferase-like domain-containing protein n=1 Tax=Acinetobacter towneri TaxID=202956 RepID=UPI0029340E32|nr:PLP-dependent aminotransferase family protein [Acinetobacter towneri]WOE30111.1 PLP-dependent aminotransferase family protein [Acinetobacter towneri]
MYKSEQLALNIRQLIENGAWKAHSKLPSLREQSQISGYSLMTVLNAYQELEAQGLVYAKQKSGFYVVERLNQTERPVPSSLSLNAHIQMNSLVFGYLKSIQSADVSPLGSAFPNAELLFNPKLMQILAQHAKRKSSYFSHDHMPPGNYELRTIIANRYCLQGIPTHANDIVITSGALDALNLSLQALTKPGDFILLQETIFYGAWQAAERLGLQVITIPEHPVSGFDIASFEQALKQYPIKVCWLMLNSHNPIGFSVRHEIKQRIAELLEEYQVYLIEDDVYQELYYGAQKPLPMKYFDKTQRVLHCSSFSKTLGAAVRVGWVYAGQFSNAIQHLQLMSTVSASPLLQNSLVDFLSHHHYDKHVRLLRSQLEKHKKVFYQQLKQRLNSACKIHYYSSGYFLWVELPINLDGYAVYQALIQQQIGIAPSQLFRSEHVKQNFIRLNCSFAWTAEIEHAVTVLAQVIQQHITAHEQLEI